ncbi:hypothetical protein GLOIN_2v1610554 [Rhizophagus irregularis DAOM 181602=DAOM 197198]|uniref:Uncharacterized protein n=1 Tax=Rhizophagus irregularis (strain DAOM 181602 / DAOM 197198 / MUCL 43194) TaxID=747089 RepID=A0A2P4Q026_RHIID|nr:hypothetical protein GLOIN_2v1610554 [Rhizophagus irregularis DAOM 181602=DAOM 197198]POG70993.1 hypothetical protein GLOIN_2v1610554 [Rhizophagus irregularis DAOM 181602=DAOM 197198]|eukprot:XP_025177859.1 hypothetical protein GLOIN_2v1610554 [Rhizophagus irregularis DAOM 181602=DAOM 197198]
MLSTIVMAIPNSLIHGHVLSHKDYTKIFSSELIQHFFIIFNKSLKLLHPTEVRIII